MSFFKYILILVSACRVCIAQQIPGIVADYSFNRGQAADDLNGMAARTKGTSFVKDRFGNPKSAIYLHGNYGSFLSLGNRAELKLRQGTISLWVKIDEVPKKGYGITVNPIIFTKNGFGDDFFEGYFLEYNYETRKIVATQTFNNLQQVTLASSDTFPLRKWQHLAISFNDDSLWLYVNGERDISMEKKFISRYDQNDSVMVGHTANFKNLRFLNGSVDDIKFFNRVLNHSEIDALYGATDPKRFHAFMKWLGLISLYSAGIVLTIWAFIRRYKKALENEKEKNRIQFRMYELETRAMKAQMNPHFIFNSLCSVQRLILDGEAEMANEYLTRFARLLRRLLESSVSDTICLQEEIEVLENYIQIEKNRFENSFSFEINSELKNKMAVHIPFMMVQPFVENAIWHGLMPKNGSRELRISFRDFDEYRMICIVDDNGVGRANKAAQNDLVRKNSLSTDFITQRLEILGKLHHREYYLKITDKKDQNNINSGTNVELLIPKYA